MKYNPTIVAAFLASFGIPNPEFEFRFHPERKWRFDLAWPAAKVALEIDGAVWSGGRHTRGSGWLKDTEKLNAAACLGWRMLRCTPQQLMRNETVVLLKSALTNST
jgi:very-short-patch-repair endonuclease